MTITIGQTSDDRRKVQKSFTGSPISVQLKQPCDLLHPVFIMAWSNTYVHANYLYAPDFGRYYYIDDVILLTGSRAELQCSVDVLMSYRDQILALSCMVIRNEDYAKRAKKVQDTNMVTDGKTVTSIYTSDNTIFNTGTVVTDLGHYVLQVVGGSTGGE